MGTDGYDVENAIIDNMRYNYNYVSGSIENHIEKELEEELINKISGKIYDKLHEIIELNMARDEFIRLLNEG